jgi:hypothetical protein
MTGSTGELPIGPLHDRIEHLHRIGSGELPLAAFAPGALAVHIIGLLLDPCFDALPQAERRTVLFRVLLIYSGSWNSAGRAIIPAVERVLAGLLAEPERDLDALCVAYDLLYFLYWCWDTSVADQVGFGSQVVAPFAAAIRAAEAPEPTGDKTLNGQRTVNHRVGYLAEFVTPGPGNAIAVANRVLLRTLARAGKAYRPILYAWMFHDPGTLADYEALGVEVRAITAASPAERIALTEAAIRADRPDVLMTDMNASLPAVLFERRSAPLQVFYQFGMPIWPLRNIDAVFHVWDFDRALVGFDQAICTELTIPYDLTRFASTPDPELVAIERAQLPLGRLIGTYGRLAKITPEFLRAVADAISDIPDVTVVLGGVGDADPINRRLAALGMIGRCVVLAHHVNGHVWGHLMDVFLDTFPQPGGASCLEVIAKGKPVVSMFAGEAPNLMREQRVRSLVAGTVADYSAIVRQLLTKPMFYARACSETRALAARYPTEDDYLRDITRAIDALRAWRSGSRLFRWAERFWTRRGQL